MKKSKTLITGSLVGAVLVALIIAASWMAMANSENQSSDKIVKPASKVRSMQSTVIGINNDGKSHDNDIETNDGGAPDIEKNELTDKDDPGDLNEADTEDKLDQKDIQDSEDD